MQRAEFGLIGLCFVLSLAGCSPQQYFHTQSPTHGMEFGADYERTPRTNPMFAGHSGAPVGWPDLLKAIAWAEIIVLGEQHDDAMAHAVQLAVVQDTLDRWPRSAVSMEMLERDEQVLVDDYLDGIIDTSDFIRLTFSANWGGPNTWEDWFQPIIDAAKARGASVIAANAPRRYVRMARLRGYEALDALPANRRAFFDRPRSLPRNEYFERFSNVMAHIDNPDALDAIFRSQMVWDATMARSIVNARPSRRAKIVHLVGRFHSDFDGGLIQEIRRHRPTARILTVSMRPTDAMSLLDDDFNRADVVIYTGEKVEDEPDADAEELNVDVEHP